MKVKLEWWEALMPVIVGLAIVLIAFTVAVIVWANLAIRLCTGGIELEADREFRLDMLLKTAKICFLGHGYTSLIGVALALLVLKLHHWPNLAVVYPLLPLIVLGTVYIFLAIMFK